MRWVIWDAGRRRVAVWNRAERIHVAQDRDKWHTLVNNKFQIVKDLIGSHAEFCSMMLSLLVKCYFSSTFILCT
jgi:hypothetical protein